MVLIDSSFFNDLIWLIGTGFLIGMVLWAVWFALNID